MHREMDMSCRRLPQGLNRTDLEEKHVATRPRRMF